MILDRIARPEQAIAMARAYAATNKLFPDMASFGLPVALPKASLARNALPLQAADFMAWECRKNVEDYDGWFESREDGKRGCQYDSFIGHERAKENNKGSPFHRRSMAQFMRRTKTLLWCRTSDMPALENSARSGVWSPAAQRRQLSRERAS